MGVSHLSPTGTRHRFSEIFEYEGNHVDVTDIDSRIEAEHMENSVINHFTRNYSFSELHDHEWISDNQKVVAETGHGIELRILYHPSGNTVYFYLVATTGEFEKQNLAVQHLQTYYEDLKQVLEQVFGSVRRKTSAWTSEKIEVKA